MKARGLPLVFHTPYQPRQLPVWFFLLLLLDPAALSGGGEVSAKVQGPIANAACANIFPQRVSVTGEELAPISLTPMHNYRGNFEVHLTVNAGSGMEAFRAWCEVERCKCVRIVLARGSHVEQPMATWRRGETVLPEVLAEATQRARDLEHAGFEVVRVKIEADPANDDVPATEKAARLAPASNYFEHHVKLRRETAAGTELLLRVCLEHAAHLSRNAWRQPAHGFEERFVTLRSYQVGWPASEQRLQALLASLRAAGEQILDVESEYTVYDSNLALDAGWLPHAAT